QTQRRLSEDIAPTGWRAHVGIAEPDGVVEGLAALGPSGGQPGGHYRRVAKESDLLLAVVLALVDHPAAAGFIGQVGLGEALAGASDEDEVVGEDAVHGGDVILLDSGLILRVESGDGLEVVIRG